MRARPKILVIDDDADLLEVTDHLLRRYYEVVTCRATFGRLNFVREQQPDLVLMDVNLPLVPGDELTRLIKDAPELAEIPVVLFSSNDEHSLQRMAEACGAQGYIPKSELGGDLVSKVERHLRVASQACAV